LTQESQVSGVYLPIACCVSAGISYWPTGFHISHCGVGTHLRVRKS
jgi:hypothetical protein